MGVKLACNNVAAKLPFVVLVAVFGVELVAAVVVPVPFAAPVTPEDVMLLDSCLVIGLKINFVAVAVGAEIIEFVADLGFVDRVAVVLV